MLAYSVGVKALIHVVIGIIVHVLYSGIFQGCILRQLKSIKEEALDQVHKHSYHGVHLGNMDPGPLGEPALVQSRVAVTEKWQQPEEVSVAGLLPGWGTIHGLGAHRPFPLCVVNSSGCDMNGKEADSELST